MSRPVHVAIVLPFPVCPASGNAATARRTSLTPAGEERSQAAASPAGRAVFSIGPEPERGLSDDELVDWIRMHLPRAKGGISSGGLP